MLSLLFAHPCSQCPILGCFFLSNPCPPPRGSPQFSVLPNCNRCNTFLTPSLPRPGLPYHSLTRLLSGKHDLFFFSFLMARRKTSVFFFFPHPEAGLFAPLISLSLGPKDGINPSCCFVPLTSSLTQEVRLSALTFLSSLLQGKEVFRSFFRRRFGTSLDVVFPLLSGVIIFRPSSLPRSS